jgi:hypothetical protein
MEKPPPYGSQDACGRAWCAGQFGQSVSDVCPNDATYHGDDLPRLNLDEDHF